MSEPMTIDEIEVVRQPRDPSRCAGATSTFTMRLTIFNNCSDMTLYATADVTSVDYIHDNRLLRVGFHAFQSDNERKWRRPFVASHVPVGPRGTSALTGRIASPITYFQRTDDAVGELRQIALESHVDIIDFSVTYTDECPPLQINLALGRPAPEIPWRTIEGRWIAKRHDVS